MRAAPAACSLRAATTRLQLQPYGCCLQPHVQWTAPCHTGTHQQPQAAMSILPAVFVGPMICPATAGEQLRCFFVPVACHSTRDPSMLGDCPCVLFESARRLSSSTSCFFMVALMGYSRAAPACYLRNSTWQCLPFNLSLPTGACYSLLVGLRQALSDGSCVCGCTWTGHIFDWISCNWHVQTVPLLAVSQ